LQVVSALLRFFSYLYHGLLALALILFGMVVAVSGSADSVRVDVLPWTGSTLLLILILGGIIGLLSVFLAIRGTIRPLFFLWALVVTIYLARGYFLGGHRFTPEEFKQVVYLVVGSLIALLGAFIQMFRRTK
jgi:hypothetical protein